MRLARSVSALDAVDGSHLIASHCGAMAHSFRVNAVRFWQCPNALIGGWAGRVADRLKREHEALHHVELERAFMDDYG